MTETDTYTGKYPPVDRSSKGVGRSYTSDKNDVERLCEIESGLSQWEVSFVESVARQVIDRMNTLTEKQRQVVDGLLEKHCA